MQMEWQNMEWIDTGVTQQAIGIPTEDDLKRLESEGYTRMLKGKTKSDNPESYEIWVK